MSDFDNEAVIDSEDEILNLPPPPTTLLAPKTPRQKRKAPPPPDCIPTPDSPEIVSRSRKIDLDYSASCRSNRSTLKNARLRADCQAETVSEYFASRLCTCSNGCSVCSPYDVGCDASRCKRSTIAKICSFILFVSVGLVTAAILYVFLHKRTSSSFGLLLIGGDDGGENKSLDFITSRVCFYLVVNYVINVSKGKEVAITHSQCYLMVEGEELPAS